MAVFWSNAYIIGVDEIDRQHRRIAEYLMQLHSHIENEDWTGYELELLLELLYEYLQLHFQVEDSYMQMVACPIGEKNKLENTKLLDFITGFNLEYVNSSVITDKKGLLVNLYKTLEEWLMNHLCRVDLNLKNCRNCNMS